MYNSVTEFFDAEYPHLVGMLNNPGGFWPAVKTNTISNDELDRERQILEAFEKFNSSVYRASVALMIGRLLGKITNPG